METVVQHFQHTGEHVSGFVKYVSSSSNNGEKRQSLMESTLNASLVNGPHTLERIDIDPRDFNTPDNWIPRHQYFITPTPLHYVRNHGSVPKLHWDTHRLVVDG
ncbi:4742_t:CDS:2, partial [Acaulospora morrowiae]